MVTIFGFEFKITAVNEIETKTKTAIFIGVFFGNYSESRSISA